MTKLSVVMSVFNGAASLEATLRSIFDQTERDFELIIVDDGSTDATPELLASHARHDRRLRVVTQQNQGLTRSLIRGCTEAKAPVIARHDCGDRSHPERFARQLTLLEEGHVLASCAVHYVGPGGETLYLTKANGDEVRESLLHSGVDHIRGIPHHGSAMFRRDAYLEAGGYRPQFRFAQDLDLWIRMTRLGSIGIAEEVLYEAEIGPSAISARHRPAQIETAALAIRLRDASPAETASILSEVAAVDVNASTDDDADGNYFIATCLMRQNDPRWRKYAVNAVRSNPLHFRAWLRLLTRWS